MNGLIIKTSHNAYGRHINNEMRDILNKYYIDKEKDKVKFWYNFGLLKLSSKPTENIPFIYVFGYVNKKKKLIEVFDLNNNDKIKEKDKIKYLLYKLHLHETNYKDIKNKGPIDTIEKDKILIKYVKKLYGLNI